MVAQEKQLDSTTPPSVLLRLLQPHHWHPVGGWAHTSSQQESPACLMWNTSGHTFFSSAQYLSYWLCYRNCKTFIRTWGGKKRGLPIHSSEPDTITDLLLRTMAAQLLRSQKQGWETWGKSSEPGQCLGGDTAPQLHGYSCQTREAEHLLKWEPFFFFFKCACSVTGL